MVLPLILGGIATFASGAWIGSVVDDATEKPVQITAQTATVDNGGFSLSRKDLLLYGALGVGAYFIYRKYFKK